MHAKAGEILEVVDQLGVLGCLDARGKRAAWGYGASGRVVVCTGDVGGTAEADHVNVLVACIGLIVTETVAITDKKGKSVFAKVDNVGDTTSLAFLASGHLDNPLAHKFRLCSRASRQLGRRGDTSERGNVKLEHAEVLGTLATILDQSTLENGVKRLAVKGRGQALETLVGRAARVAVSLSSEVDLTPRSRDDSLRRGDIGDDGAVSSHFVYVRSVLFRDVKGAVRVSDKALSVERDLLLDVVL